MVFRMGRRTNATTMGDTITLARLVINDALTIMVINNYDGLMAQICQALGTRAVKGNSVSHSHHKTRRSFKPNPQRKRYWVPTLGKRVTLTVGAQSGGGR